MKPGHLRFLNQLSVWDCSLSGGVTLHQWSQTLGKPHCTHEKSEDSKNLEVTCSLYWPVCVFVSQLLRCLWAYLGVTGLTNPTEQTEVAGPTVAISGTIQDSGGSKGNSSTVVSVGSWFLLWGISFRNHKRLKSTHFLTGMHTKIVQETMALLWEKTCSLCAHGPPKIT